MDKPDEPEVDIEVIDRQEGENGDYSFIMTPKN
jgi:hypothetical protein